MQSEHGFLYLLQISRVALKARISHRIVYMLYHDAAVAERTAKHHVLISVALYPFVVRHTLKNRAVIKEVCRAERIVWQPVSHLN